MTKWKIDPDHVSASFSVHHMMVTIVHGLFTKVRGTILFDPVEPASTSVEVEVDVASIYTGVDRRDNHLRSTDFFDVEKFPFMYFKSTTTEVVGMNLLKVTGDLTIHGITRQVIFDVTYLGPSRFIDDDKTYTTYGIDATTCIQREDFGMAWNLGIEDGGFMVGKCVDIVFSAEADLEEEAPAK
ncbi:MAG: YceI family protein [Proteobacteria bacterium]|nr:YceI family protein [Pseudomonadota bacterium]